MVFFWFRFYFILFFFLFCFDSFCFLCLFVCFFRRMIPETFEIKLTKANKLIFLLIFCLFVCLFCLYFVLFGFVRFNWFVCLFYVVLVAPNDYYYYMSIIIHSIIIMNSLQPFRQMIKLMKEAHQL